MHQSLFPHTALISAVQTPYIPKEEEGHKLIRRHDFTGARDDHMQNVGVAETIRLDGALLAIV